MTEQQVQKSIMDYIRANGWWCVKVPSGKLRLSDNGRFMALAPKGTPDIIACIRGRFCAIEVKRDEKIAVNWNKKAEIALTTEWYQKEQLEIIDKAGGLAFMVGSLSQFIKYLKETLK